jgi:hypothetical protein
MRLPDENDWTPPPDPLMHGLTMSPDIKEIASALNAALADITDAPKTATAFKYKYAPLDVVMPIVRSACHKHGLFILQTPWSPEHGQLGMATLLTHTSGQWIKTSYSVAFVPNQDNVYHQIGTSTTYLRRYSVMALMMLSAEDDDAASHTKKPKPKSIYERPRENADLINKLTRAAKKGRDTLDSAFKSLDANQKALLTAADKAALKEVSDAAN